MDDLKKKIKIAAVKLSNEYPHIVGIDSAFELGAKSPEARMYWREGMFSINDLDKWITEKRLALKRSKKYIKGLEDTINIVSSFIEHNKK